MNAGTLTSAGAFAGAAFVRGCQCEICRYHGNAGLPTTEDDLPILAVRGASLVLDRGRIRLAGVSVLTLFDLDDTARCALRPPQTHSAPHPTCSCGFYAVPADDPYALVVRDVRLQVELSGRVIVHERGYRAQFQRVLAVEHDGCGVPDCREPVLVDFVEPHQALVRGEAPQIKRAGRWCCAADHKRYTESRISAPVVTTVTPEQIGDDLGIELVDRRC